MRIRIRALALMGALTAITLLAPPAVASAAAPETYRNLATDRCMDDDDTLGFRTWNCFDNDHQRWQVVTFADNTVQLRNVRTERCIDDSDLGFRTWPCHAAQDPNSRFQRWNVDRFGNHIRFRSVATGRCIDDSGAGFRTWTCFDNNNQKWS
jgi:hypothetical protein